MKTNKDGEKQNNIKDGQTRWVEMSKIQIRLYSGYIGFFACNCFVALKKKKKKKKKKGYMRIVLSLWFIFFTITIYVVSQYEKGV